jgi:hypothetical protein
VAGRIAAAIYDVLKNNSGVSALVSTRIYPLAIPQDATLPAIQYQKISSRGYYTHDGEAAIRSRIQISAVAETYDAADDIAGVRIFSCFLEGERDGFGILNDLAVVQQDYMILHGE